MPPIKREKQRTFAFFHDVKTRQKARVGAFGEAVMRDFFEKKKPEQIAKARKAPIGLILALIEKVTGEKVGAQTVYEPTKKEVEPKPKRAYVRKALPKKKQEKGSTKIKTLELTSAKKKPVEEFAKPSKTNAARARERAILTSENMSRSYRTLGTGDLEYWREFEKPRLEDEKKMLLAYANGTLRLSDEEKVLKLLKKKRSG